MGFIISIKITINKKIKNLKQTILELNKNYMYCNFANIPKLYEYFGLIILFYSNEHDPIHVHGKYQNRESKAILIFENGKFKQVKVSSVKGKRPLGINELKKFKKLVELFRDDIVNKWIDFFVFNREIKAEIITKKI